MSESNSKKFDYLLSRHNIRESTSLTLATVASSASLVLLGLPTTDQNFPIRMVFGILFVSFGFLYNDITRRYLQRESTEEILDMIEKNKECVKDTKQKIRRIRHLSINTLLLLPILGWTFTYFSNSLLCAVLTAIIVIIVIIAVTFSTKIDYQTQK